MASKLTVNEIVQILTQTDMISKFVRDNYTNLMNKINEMIDEWDAAQIGTTNAETTAARPYHVSLKARLDSQWNDQANYIKEGGLVAEQGVPDMTVAITAGEAKVDGVDVKWSSQNSGTITAPAVNDRFDVVVINSDSSVSVVTGSESATPIYPPITQLQKAVKVITLTAATATITDTIMVDARDMGAWYDKEGVHKYEWLIQDAIDDLSSRWFANEGGNIYVGWGAYQEDLTFDDNQVVTFAAGATVTTSAGATFDLGAVDLLAKTASKIIWGGGENHSNDIERSGSVNIGNDASTHVDGTAVAVGNNADATATGAIAIGDTAAATDDDAIAVGESAAASASTAIAIGKDSIADEIGSIAVGEGTETLGPNDTVIKNTIRPEGIRMHQDATLTWVHIYADLAALIDHNVTALRGIAVNIIDNTGTNVVYSYAEKTDASTMRLYGFRGSDGVLVTKDVTSVTANSVTFYART